MFYLAGNPTAITNTLWLNFTMNFGLRGRQEHTQMQWGDVTLKKTTEGLQYLEFSSERLTKTRQGQKGATRSFPPKLFEIPGKQPLILLCVQCT